MSRETAFKLENVNFSYNKGQPLEFQALKNISLEIFSGEYVSFLGPSGCGKSTLLYVISGIDKATEGKITVNGANLIGLGQTELSVFRQHNIGFIFQNFNLIPTIKNIDNVILPLMFSGMPRKERRERALNLLEKLEIKHLAERYPTELSGGQQQRVGIARALANNPPIILADEPIGNLDSSSAEILLNYLKEINEKEGKTVIIVTHEPWSMRDVRRVFHMKDGVIFKEEAKAVSLKPEEKPEEKKEIDKNVEQDLSYKTKRISSLVFGGFSEEETNRFEKFVKDRLMGVLDSEGLRKALDLPFKSGGVGLWFQSARRISEVIEEYIANKIELELLRQKISEDAGISLEAEAEKFRQWLCEEHNIHLSGEQVIKFDEIIADRVRGNIKPDQFLKLLNLPQKENGVGINIRTSLKITDKIEALMELSRNPK